MNTTNDTTKTTRKLRQIDLYTASNCEPDLLAEVPRVTLGPNGKPHIIIMPAADDEVGEEVEATVSLPRSDLTLVRTKVGAYVMHTSDYEANLPKWTDEELVQRDLHNFADGICAGVMATFNPTDDTADFLWHTGNRLVMDGGLHGRVTRLGQMMCLDALIASPDALQAALVGLREQMRLSDPGVDILK